MPKKAKWAQLGYRVIWCGQCGQGAWNWSRKPRLSCSEECAAARERERIRERRRTDPEFRERQREYQRRPELREKQRIRRRTREAEWSAEQWERERARQRGRPQRWSRRAEASQTRAVENALLRQALAEAIRELMPPPATLMCAVCGATFTGERGRRTYCSDDCCRTGTAIRNRDMYRQQHGLEENDKRLLPRLCGICGEMFTPPDFRRTSYCSQVCSKEADRRQRRRHERNRKRERARAKSRETAVLLDA